MVLNLDEHFLNLNVVPKTTFQYAFNESEKELRSSLQINLKIWKIQCNSKPNYSEFCLSFPSLGTKSKYH